MYKKLLLCLFLVSCGSKEAVNSYETLPLSGLPEAAEAYSPAERLTPPTEPSTTVTVAPTTTILTGLNGFPYAPYGLDLCQEMNFYRVQWNLPARFDDSGRHQLWVKSDGLGWRESKCQNHLISSTGCCGGYWQLNIPLFLKDHRMKPLLHACDVYSLSDVTGIEAYDKQRQACAAYALYTVDPTAWRPM